jgi:hypothetical protein
VTEIRDGKTISIRAYLDREEALEAAGLSSYRGVSIPCDTSV